MGGASRCLQVAVALACLAACGEPRVVDEGSRVRCATTKGDILIEMTPHRGPMGAQRFMDLIDAGFFTDIPLFRVVKGFLVQYGIPGRMEAKEQWQHWVSTHIEDDPHPMPAKKSILKRGDMSFAGAGPNTRTTQVFITYQDRNSLGTALHETPFGTVIEGMDVVDSFYADYGDTAPFGKNGPNQGRMWHEGSAYIRKEFPHMDFMLHCAAVEKPTPAPPVPKPTAHPTLLAVPTATKQVGAAPSLLPFYMILLVLVGMCSMTCIGRGKKEKH